MRKRNVVLLVVLTCALSATARGDKQKGSAKLKDFQPAGATDKKNKTQQYEYTCRTKEKLKATDFPVGSDTKYEIDKDKGQVKNMSGKGGKCTVVRVEQLQAAPA